jgi:5-methylcytosine-specific restriction endonuclease McrA
MATVSLALSKLKLHHLLPVSCVAANTHILDVSIILHEQKKVGNKPNHPNSDPLPNTARIANNQSEDMRYQRPIRVS